MANTYTLPGVLLTGTHAGRVGAGTVAKGTLYAETDTGAIFQSDGSSWSAWGSTAVVNPMTTAQDVIVGGVSGAPGRLAIGAAGGALVSLNGVVAYNSGTSFPGSKVTGDRYWRTDLGLEAYWDGTRWLTTELFRDTFGVANTLAPDSTGTASGRLAPWATAFDLWLVAWDITTFVATTNDGTHYWNIGLYKFDASDSATSIDSFNTSADTVNNWTQRRRTLGASYVASSFRGLSNIESKTSTPGALYFASSLEYRLILT